MKITAHTFISLDGVMQGPGGAQEDTSNGFELGGWIVPWFDDSAGAVVASWFAKPAALLLGHSTFDIFRSFWPQVVDDADPVAKAINTRAKYVAATTPVDAEPWADATTVLGADSLTELRRLKETPGAGSADPRQSRVAADPARHRADRRVPRDRVPGRRRYR